MIPKRRGRRGVTGGAPGIDASWNVNSITQATRATQAPLGAVPREDMAEVDPRAVFLLRAAAHLDLFEAGELSLDEAFAGLIAAFDEIMGAEGGL
jgi:hypothetical protein